jgi:hypothetical protein
LAESRGYALVVEPGVPTREWDTVTCSHCQRVVFTKPGSASTVYLLPKAGQPGQFREEPGAFCRVCMKPVCLACDRHGGCTPWERRMERMEARDRFLRAVGV